MNYNYSPYQQQPPQQYGYMPQQAVQGPSNQMAEAQMRLLRAQQANLLYKQTMVRNILLTKQVEQQNQARQQQQQNQQQQQFNPQQYQPQARNVMEQLDRNMGLPDRKLNNDMNAQNRNENNFSSSTQNSRSNSIKPNETRPADDTNDNSNNKGDNNGNESPRKMDEREKKAREKRQKPKPENKDTSDSLSLAAKKTLAELNENMNKVVDENKETLDKTHANETQKRENEKKTANQENKKKFESLIKKSEGNPIRFPLWKHRMLRNDKYYNPPADTVLKGKSLWKAITISVIVLFVKPMVLVRRLKTKLKDKEKAELQRALLIYAETADDWLGKLVQLPIASIVQVRVVCVCLFLSISSSCQPQQQHFVINRVAQFVCLGFVPVSR